jgi:hypothetical protein
MVRHDSCVPPEAEEFNMPHDPKHEAQKDEPQSNATPGDPELQNEGEGSRTAARRYDEKAQRAAKDDQQVEKLAKDAAQALDGPEGEELRKAEERGKRSDHK